MKKERCCAGLLLLYGVVMLWLLFFQREPRAATLAESVQNHTNFVPFATIRHQLHLLGGPWTRFAVVNLLGNVVMFLPLGLLPALWIRQRKLGWYLLTVGLLIVIVEAVQVFCRVGSGDVDDWILNMLGASMGYALWRLRRKNTES